MVYNNGQFLGRSGPEQVQYFVSQKYFLVCIDEFDIVSSRTNRLALQSKEFCCIGI